jgi:hypothetical protein
MATVWIAYGAAQVYRKGFERGRRVGRSEPPRPKPLTDGMTIEEAAEASGVTVEQFRRAISGR